MTAKGVAVKLKSYEETIPNLLRVIKFDNELKKHDRIVLKPHIEKDSPELSTKPDFLETVIKFCMAHKNPGTEILIADGCDGADTLSVFDSLGYSKIAEKYSIGLVDLNYTETRVVQNPEFLRFESIHYPEILLNSFVISMPELNVDEELSLHASLDNMIGAFPAKNYKGFFSSTKNKLSKHALKYQIHDILKCKVPDFAIIDAHNKGMIIAGQAIDMDKQAAKALGLDWNKVPHLRLIHESFSSSKKEESVDKLIGEEQKSR